MSEFAIPGSLPLSSATDAASGQQNVKVKDAAQQFEALLIGEILRSARETSGCFGSGQDSSSDCAFGFAEQQLSMVLAKRGGLGLAGLIASGLEHKHDR